MKFNSQICTTREQSERLLALGLKKETADMTYNKLEEMVHPLPYTEVMLAIERSGGSIWSQFYFPTWSLYRLIEMMPTIITHDDYSLILGITSTCCYYADNEYAETFKAFEGNLYDCVVKCIEWLIKEGYFNKEYLEE